MSMPEPKETTTKKRAVVTNKRTAVTPSTPAKRERERDPIPHRQIWGGAAALVSAMLLIVLFPRVLHAPASATTTTTATKHPTALPTLAPTATPAPLSPRHHRDRALPADLA